MDTLDSLKMVGAEFYGEVGAWAYERFDHHNAKYFDNMLDAPLIRFELTAHGRAGGLCSSSPTGKTIITIAPWIVNERAHVQWTHLNAIVKGTLNVVDDILLHEMIHQEVNIRCRNSGEPQPTQSHNNDYWIAACNRIAAQLGFTNYKAGKYTSRRRRKDDGGGTYKSTARDCVEYKEMYAFPHPTYIRLGSDRYKGSKYDFEADSAM